MNKTLTVGRAWSRILDSSSVRVRFVVSVISNGGRALLSFASGMLVARSLLPSAYGDLSFLLGSFVAFQSLLDMGTSGAFFTLISQEPRARNFYLTYFSWQGLQFLVAAAFVGMLCPSTLLNAVWLGHSRGLVLLAFLATFIQQQLWLAVSQIGEGSRQSVRVQSINLSIALVHLILVSVCIWLELISVQVVLYLMIAEYVAAIVSSYWILGRPSANHSRVSAMSYKSILMAYWRYCKPLAILSTVTFSYFFADRWMLQRFGGGAEQGFYQVSSQFAAVALLATTSILKIFWKEIAEANARQDHLAVQRMHSRAFRGLVMVSASLACLLIPWSSTIVEVFLGRAYRMAAPVVAIMLIYPVLQTMGQINGTTLLASGHTRTYAAVSSVFMLISIPVTYIVQSPINGWPVPGFGGGALGMAIKMVGLGFASVNVQAWVLARIRHWRFDWAFPLVAIGITLAIGYAARSIVALIWHLSSAGFESVWPAFLACTLLYAAGVAGVVWLFPTFAGLERSDLCGIVTFFRGRRSSLELLTR